MTAGDPDDAAAGEPQQVTVVFRKPDVRPGTPEAEAAGCLCRFESNMEAGFLSLVPGHEDEVMTFVELRLSLASKVSDSVNRSAASASSTN